MIQQGDFIELKKRLEEKNTGLVAVSKFQSLEKIHTLYDWGHRDFGENYVQELVEKYEALPKDIRWHFIGHLQTNKVKYIAPFIHLIHSVDSYKLLKEINKQAILHARTIDVLIQIYVGDENTKYGLDEKETLELLSLYEQQQESFSNIRICGFMGMATNTENIQQIVKDFKEMDALFSNMKLQFFYNHNHFKILCMGMSNDFNEAIEQGSSLVRIGSSIFGNRQ